MVKTEMRLTDKDAKTAKNIVSDVARVVDGAPLTMGVVMMLPQS